MDFSNTQNTSATVQRLRSELLDKQLHLAPQSMLNCAAHMLFCHSSQDAVHRIALQFLLEKFGATRTSLGYGDPGTPQYAPRAVETTSRLMVPVIDQPIPNHMDSIQRVWQTPEPVQFNPQSDHEIEKMWAAVGTKAKLARRLEAKGHIFGLLCIDDTLIQRQWRTSDIAYLDQFVLCFLGPILDSYSATLTPTSSTLTSAEVAVIRLAIRGFTYKEIASALAKSTNTVDNQLRSARAKLGARNKVELAQAFSSWLNR
jgi:DNA-binding CsgD family transcriptional regulator